MAMKSVRRKVLSAVAVGAAALGMTIVAAPAADASAQTCIAATEGFVCTNVSGSGTHVDRVGVSRDKAPDAICNYNAWFYYVPPEGGANDLGYQERAGCVAGRAWFDVGVDRTFAPGTLLCAKWHEDYTTLIGEKCVGVS
jgi:hypothetical protein